jgi:hypothetical protein
VELCPTNLPLPPTTDNPDWAWETLPCRGPEQARRYLNGLLNEVGLVGQLRHLLAMESKLPVSRLNDAQVLDAVATLLADRHWVVRQKALTTAARIKNAQRQASAASGTDSTPAVSPSRLRGPTEAAPATQAAPAPEADFAHIDHDAQAATLAMAAKQGVPFCEMCAAAAAMA